MVSAILLFSRRDCLLSHIFLDFSSSPVFSRGLTIILFYVDVIENINIK